MLTLINNLEYLDGHSSVSLTEDLYQDYVIETHNYNIVENSTLKDKYQLRES